MEAFNRLRNIGLFFKLKTRGFRGNVGYIIGFYLENIEYRVYIRNQFPIFKPGQEKELFPSCSLFQRSQVIYTPNPLIVKSIQETGKY